MDITFSKKDIAQVARSILQYVDNEVLAFYGAMGTGKTTLIKAILVELGAADTGSSPTFGIVNEYHGKDGRLLAYHFDFYRLRDEEEALDLGFEEYLDKQCRVFIEWPEKISGLLPAALTEIHLEALSSGQRRLQI